MGLTLSQGKKIEPKFGNVT